MIGEAILENLVNLTTGIRQAAHRADMPLPHDPGAATFMGVDIRPSDVIDRRSVVTYGGVAFMHPHTLEVLKISLVSGRRMSDPEVQLEASLVLIRQTLDRREQAAIDRMRDAVRDSTLASDHFHLIRWCEMERWPHAYVQWSTDRHYLPNVWECWDCGQKATAESMASAGVDLGRA